MPKKAKSKTRSEKVVAALNHPLRIAILQEMARQEVLYKRAKAMTEEERSPEDAKILLVGPVLSPNLLSSKMDEPLGNVSYHVKTLLKYDCVELVKTEPRRGAVEHFYISKVKKDWALEVLGLKDAPAAEVA